MTTQEFESAQQRMWQDYYDSWMKSGTSTDEAAARVAFARESLLPAGTLPAGHRPLNIVSAEATVGFVLLAERIPDIWYMYGFLLDADHRGHGYGRAALRCTEDFARARGGLKLEFNVFAFNTVMREMVSTEGYESVSTVVAKPL